MLVRWRHVVTMSAPRPRQRTALARAAPPTTPDTSPILAALHSERVAALAAATLATKRADRLDTKLETMSAAAVEALKRGDEAGARAVLVKRALTAAAAEAARKRAGANAALAAGLGVRMERVRRGG